MVGAISIVLLSVYLNVSLGDEVVIDSKTNSKMLGDFDCSTCFNQLGAKFELSAGPEQGELQAGQLWKFFDAQGISSLDRLTLSLDLEQIADSSKVGLQKMVFRIEDPSSLGDLLTDVSLGNNSLVVPGYETSSFKPEAKLEIALGYDFMQRFSADSKERISIDYSIDGDESSNPVFSIGSGSGFLEKFHTVAIIGFAGFWIIVFLVLNRFTKPVEASVEPAAVLPQREAAPKRRALSA